MKYAEYFVDISLRSELVLSRLSGKLFDLSKLEKHRHERFKIASN